MNLKLVALCAVISLGGCASTGGISSSNIQAIIGQVQSATVTACGFLPTVSSVGAILATLVGASAAEQAIVNVASQICAAVLLTKGVRSAVKVVPRVNGVAIHGRFVR